MLSKLKKLKFSWPKIFMLIFVVVFLISPTIFWPGGIGIGKDKSIVTTTVETVKKDKQSNLVKTVEITAHNDGKTIWDWLSLLGVPLALFFLGAWLQEEQQKRADNESKEEILQTYFDRLSLLLIDKNLIALSNRLNSNKIEPEEKELLDSTLDVIRARTLSILRRFAKDAERKTSVIDFLREAKIITKCKINLSEADLSLANLQGAKLQGVNLLNANLQGADLSLANLQGANLSEADLSFADLSLANLQEANLLNANLQGANLQGTDLSLANLQGANLDSTQNLTNSQIKEACYWEKAIYAEAKFNEKKQSWTAKNEKANQKKIDEIKQDQASDSEQPVDC